jgi:competence protein ComEC
VLLTQWYQYKLIIKTAAHTQWVLTLVLIPLTALFFNQTSLVSPLANAVAIPIMGWISTPIALLAAVLSGVWQPAAVLLMRILLFVQTMMEWILDALLRIPYASIHIPSTPWFWQVFGVLAAISCAFLTRRRILGYIAVVVFIVGSICFTVYLSWDKSAWRIVFLDVGQGMAVVIHSQGRTLLFDTGPRYGSESDGAERVILPYLYSVGVHSLDHAILSHADEDHSGGVSSLVTQMPIKQWWYSLAPQHRLLTLLPSNRLPCQAGKQLLWAGLTIQFLHPPTSMTPLDFLNRSTNSVSCVLKISSMNGNKQQHSVLLTGDIESTQELNLVNEYGQMLQSTILLSPHHGSKTSSRIEFLNEVNPEHIVIQNGYRNRYGHPHPLVSQRYTEAGIKQWRSDADGAIVVDINSELDEPIKIQAWRTVAKRYWHTVMPPTD